MKKLIKAVTIGDIEGIGIKILIKIWKKNKKQIGNFILISNYNLLTKYIKKNNIKASFFKIKNLNEIDKIFNYKIPVYNINAKNHYQNTFYSLSNAHFLAKKKIVSSIITLPLNKEKIIKKINSDFIGQTEEFQKLDKKKYSNMIFYSKKIIITSISTHIPINKVIKFIKKRNLIFNKIKLINNALKIDFNIKNPKIAITGLNPHAGEKGTIGKEEINLINPIIKKLKKININIKGPFSADTVFIKKNIKYYDCIICFYHDQALIPFKILSKFQGVNYTGSLDIIRTSPDHGTATDVKNLKNINDKSLLNSFLLAQKIYINRMRNDFVST